MPKTKKSVQLKCINRLQLGIEVLVSLCSTAQPASKLSGRRAAICSRERFESNISLIDRAIDLLRADEGRLALSPRILNYIDYGNHSSHIDAINIADYIINIRKK